MKNLNFKIFIDGMLYDTCNSKEDSIWILGAKFGARTYNDLVSEGRITFSERRVEIKTV